VTTGIYLFISVLLACGKDGKQFFSPILSGFLVVDAENFFCIETFPNGVLGGGGKEQHLHYFEL